MYEDYFGFERLPFNVTPDSEFIYYSEDHFEALSQLLYGVQERKGFIAVTGPVGSGKTTLSRAFLQEISDDTSTALILNSRMNSDELLHAIVDDFGMETPDDPTTKELIDQVNEFLLSEFRDGRNVCVIIDESQNLSPEALENLRLLSNLETEKHKLLQIVLVGQPELNDLLNRSELRQLKQRINVWVTLSNLSRDETEEYINHRLDKAGNPAIAIEDAVFDRVYEKSKGNPRSINLICDRTFLSAYVNEDKQIQLKHVEEALDNLSVQIDQDGQLGDEDAFVLDRVDESDQDSTFEWSIPGTRRSLRVAMTVALTVVVTAAIMFVYGAQSTLYFSSNQTEVSQTFRSGQENDVTNSETKANVSEPKKANQEVNQNKTTSQVQASEELFPNPLNVQNVSDPENVNGGMASLSLARLLSYRLSQGKGFDRNNLDFANRINPSISFRQLVPKYLPGQIVTLSQTVSSPRTYGFPSFLSWRDKNGLRYVLYLSEKNTIWDPLRGTLKPGEVGFSNWTGYLKVITRAEFDPSLVYKTGQSGVQIKVIQRLLNSLLDREIPTNGKYGDKMKKAVKTFQKRNDLVVDGLAGPTTNLTLLRKSDSTVRWSVDEIMNYFKAVSK